jgi:hypothetical protein
MNRDRLMPTPRTEHLQLAQNRRSIPCVIGPYLLSLESFDAVRKIHAGKMYAEGAVASASPTSRFTS